MSSDPASDASLAARIGARLRGLRVARELTLAALARDAGISTSYLSAVEKGVNLPSLRILADLTAALDVSIPSVLADEGSPHVRVSRLPKKPEALIVSHPLLQLQNAVVRATRNDRGESPIALDGRGLFIYVVEGRLQVQIDGSSFELGAGDAADAAGARKVGWFAPIACVSIWSSCPDQEH